MSSIHAISRALGRAVPILFLAPILLLSAASDEEEDSPNLLIPPDLSLEVRRLYDKAKATYDEFMAARDKGEGRTKAMEKAITQFHAVRRKKKDFHLPYYYLGIGCQIIRKFDKAERHLEKALQLQEGFYEAMAELGDTHFWKRDWKKAIDLYDQAIAVNPDYLYAYQRRIWAYTRLRKFESALEDVKKWEELEPDDELAERYRKMLEKEAEEGAFEGFFRTETDHYTLITNESRLVADEMAEQAELIFRLYTSRFPKLDKGADKFPIIYFKNREDYHAYGAPPNTGGFYSPFARKLVLFNSGDRERNFTTLYHEGFHQYVHYYIPNAPDWFGEGHGDFFGACRRVEGEKHFEILPNSGRLPYIRRVLQTGYYLPLPKLITMTRREFYDRASIGRNYAQAWSFVYFLWNYPRKGEGQYFPILAKYFRELRAGKGLREAYEQTFGRHNMEKMEEQWKGFILGLVR